MFISHGSFQSLEYVDANRLHTFVFITGNRSLAANLFDMGTIERKIIIDCDGEIMSPEEFTKEVIQRNPGAFSEEQKALLTKFWKYATYGI